MKVSLQTIKSLVLVFGLFCLIAGLFAAASDADEDTTFMGGFGGTVITLYLWPKVAKKYNL